MLPNSTNVCKVINDDSIIRASSLKVCEGARPKRIVMRLLSKGEYVVHTEYMNISMERCGLTYDVAVFTHAEFDQGTYFTFTERTKAAACEKANLEFDERAKTFRY